MSLTDSIKEWAYQVGFDAVGIATADPLLEAEQATLRWLKAGMAADMGWFTEDRAHLACHPSDLLPGARSVVVLAKSYLPPDGQQFTLFEEPRGKIARYAWGDDYHEVFTKMIDELVGFIEKHKGAKPNARIFVDGNPLAEKAVAARAGVGWYGKNGLLLTPNHGSWVLLGEIVSDIELQPDKPLYKDCGDCNLCVEICPTRALVSPYIVDARRCISYLTIENRGAIPRDLRPLLNNRIFGCDSCQEACPHNRLVRPTEDPVFSPRKELDPHPDLLKLMALDDVGFQRLFYNSPISRAKRKGLLRNVAVALGNAKDPASVSGLEKALRDREALIRSHAAWALGQIGGRKARKALEDSLALEPDEEVQKEIRLALDLS